MADTRRCDGKFLGGGALEECISGHVGDTPDINDCEVVLRGLAKPPKNSFVIEVFKSFCRLCQASISGWNSEMPAT